MGASGPGTTTADPKSQRAILLLFLRSKACICARRKKPSRSKRTHHEQQQQQQQGRQELECAAPYSQATHLSHVGRTTRTAAAQAGAARHYRCKARRRGAFLWTLLGGGGDRQVCVASCARPRAELRRSHVGARLLDAARGSGSQGNAHASHCLARQARPLFYVCRTRELLLLRSHGSRPQQARHLLRPVGQERRAFSRTRSRRSGRAVCPPAGRLQRDGAVRDAALQGTRALLRGRRALGPRKMSATARTRLLPRERHLARPGPPRKEIKTQRLDFSFCFLLANGNEAHARSVHAEGFGL